jgi:Mn2+/Fe2+ NRAMP family transporter
MKLASHVAIQMEVATMAVGVKEIAGVATGVHMRVYYQRNRHMPRK